MSPGFFQNSILIVLMIAVAFLYESQNTWYKQLSHVVASNRTHKDHVRVLTQRDLPHVKWSDDHNHDYDPVPLQLIRIANRSLHFDWLVVSDGDTCVDVQRLKQELKLFDPTIPSLIGHPMSPKWKGVCDSSACCSPHGDACRVSSVRANFYARGYSRPRIWPFGGAGYVVSKSLLNRIKPSDWKECEEKILRNGGDVRVASCILSHTGIGLTHLKSLSGDISRHKAIC